MHLPINTSIMNDHHHPHVHEEEEEEIVQTLPTSIFVATNTGTIPAGFDAVRVGLDGTLKADLSWTKERILAQEYIEKGLNIFWDIDLGLFDKLDQPLSSKSQFLSLTLSLEHFRDTLWKDYRQQTAGLCLYRGNLDFSSGYTWDEEQESNLKQWSSDTCTSDSIDKDLLRLFCRDSCGEYLDLLSQTLPDTIPMFLMFDASSIVDPYLCAQLLTKERYPRFNIGVKGISSNQILGGDMVWEGDRMHGISLERPKLGVCLQDMSCKPSDTMKKIFDDLRTKALPFRVIPSCYLTAEWDGLDDLIVESQSIDKQLYRKLQGFAAAGGKVVEL